MQGIQINAERYRLTWLDQSLSLREGMGVEGLNTMHSGWKQNAGTVRKWKTPWPGWGFPATNQKADASWRAGQIRMLSLHKWTKNSAATLNVHQTIYLRGETVRIAACVRGRFALCIVIKTCALRGERTELSLDSMLILPEPPLVFVLRTCIWKLLPPSLNCCLQILQFELFYRWIFFLYLKQVVVFWKVDSQNGIQSKLKCF